ncbi:MAG: hypothetical protein DRP84_02100 [Spirochaetes bacterium]|nr:MAG: hypothetical protein DRP84_02100 [Spirochaetota bacterium]
MKLALVFNPFKYKIHEENIRIVQKYFGLFPPLSLAWVASIAEQAGHEVIIIDARTLNLSQEEVLEILKDFNPDILGFMMTTYMFPDTLEWIRFLKDSLNIPVLIGGYNLRVYPRESVSHTEIDFGVVEHAYYTLPALFKELGKECPNYDNVPGLVYKRNGNITVTPHPQQIDFNKFPNPARHLLPNELYAEFPTERKNFTVMVTSLGCPLKCKFCEAGRTSYNPRSSETVVNEIEECYKNFGIREVDIFDYDFTVVRERVIKICKLMQDKKLDIDWACRSRVDNVNRDLLEVMKKAGCRRIYFGVESGSQEILNKVNKGITLQQINETISTCHELGIKALGFFLIGAPGDTKETVRKTITFAKKLKLDYAQFSKCLAKPLTPLWRDMVKTTGGDYWQNWILGKEYDKELPRPWTTLSNQDINKLAKRGYILFYGNPLFIIKHMLRLKSFTEFRRKLFAFFDMILRQEKTPKKDNNFKAFNENKKTTVKYFRKTFSLNINKNRRVV